MTPPENILFISYYYPPLTDVGAKRSVAFATYLKKHGWQPYVISVRNPDKSYCSLGNDAPPEGIPVWYTGSLINLYRISSLAHGALNRLGRLFGRKEVTNYFYQLFCVPDLFWGWIPLTLWRACRLIKKYNIGIIYVTCTPYTSAFIGMILKKWTGRKLVIDFRDQRGVDEQAIHAENFPLKIRRRFEEWWIRKALNLSDLFIVTTQEIRRRYRNKFSFVDGKIHTVYNGFDPSFLPEQAPVKKFDKFTIIYTGDYYFYALTSTVFFEALALLKSRNEINAQSFQFLYYGEDLDEMRRQTEAHGISDLVRIRERIPYSAVIDEIRRSHLQLIRIVPPMISTKVFEGLALNIPFLATIQSPEVEELIKDFSPASSVISSESAEDVAEAILKSWERYRSSSVPENRVQPFLDKFSREQQTLRFKSLMEQYLL